MNRLYYTTNDTKVVNLAKQYAKQKGMSFLKIDFDAQNLLRIYKYTNDLVLCVRGLNKSPKMDILLTLLENNTKNIELFAISSTYDVKPAIESRFNEIKFIENNNDDKLEYYVNLANKIVDRHDNNMHNDLAKVVEIVDKIQMSTNNLLWSALEC